ncbi:MAG: hypothetical protein L6R40_008336, partial [Gallowayella cf. fulva]
MTAPPSKSNITIGVNPPSAAQCSNVFPFSSVIDVSAPPRRSSSAAFSCPLTDAQYKAV